MKKITTLAVAALLGMTMVATTASADAKKGQKIFAKMLKAPCGMTGAKFAAKHTQDQWEAIGAGKMAAEISKICPKVKPGAIPAAAMKDLNDFAYEFASDSGNVPAC